MTKYEECFICITSLCPKCLPFGHGNKYRGLIPACNKCQNKYKHKTKDISGDTNDEKSSYSTVTEANAKSNAVISQSLTIHRSKLDFIEQRSSVLATGKVFERGYCIMDRLL